jgi:hypothetical protein
VELSGRVGVAGDALIGCEDGFWFATHTLSLNLQLLRERERDERRREREERERERDREEVRERENSHGYPGRRRCLVPQQTRVEEQAHARRR